MFGLARVCAFAGVALATTQPWFEDTLVARDIEIRQDKPKCDPKGYTSLNGLNFTSFCDQNNPFNDAQDPFKTATMEDCIEHCSRFWGKQEGCFGIVWAGNGNCWLRNSTTSTANLKPSPGDNSALVVDTQMRPMDTKCPAPDASVNKLSGVDGMAYTMNCGKVISGFDACFSDFPKPCLTEPYKGFFHTETIEECLRICVDQQPLCKAVSWSPDLKIGFANCWPKTEYSSGSLRSPGNNAGVIHTATITQIDAVDSKCPDKKSYVKEKNEFEIRCGQTSSGLNMTNLHTQNLTSCMDACASSTSKCVGVVFDSSLSGGFKNCYLQNTTNTVSELAVATYAALSSSSSNSPGSGSNANGSSNSSSSSSSSSSGSSSKAWIAGPVIGGIAFLALLAFLAFFWRRRKARSASAVAEKDGRDFGQYGPALAYSPGGAAGPTAGGMPPGGFYDPPPQAGAHSRFANEPVEMNGQGGEARELPTTDKYAHADAKAGRPALQELP